MLVVPSPKFQSHDAGTFVEASVKVTASGAAPVSGVAVKFATGAGVAAGETTIFVCAELDPPALPAVRATVYVPGFRNV